MLFRFLSLVFSVVLVSASNFTLSDVKRVTSGSSVPIPGRYIVEFDTSAHLTSSGFKRDSSPHEHIYRQLEERGVSYNVHYTYSSSLFTGVSLSLASNADLASLASLSGIINILPVRLITLPVQSSSLNDSQWSTKSPSTSGKQWKPSTTASSSSKPSTTTTCTGKGKKQTCTTSTIGSKPSSTASTYPTTGFSNLGQIQADKVQASGNKGKGIKVAIVDGGVDYTRTPLGGCFGTGCKIAGGYDFVGDDYDGTNTPVPDSDPFDNCYQHGSILAGIIGANDNEYNVTGVAPEASIYVYRVFGCNGATTDDLVIQGMQRAYDDGVDIINLSFQETSGWTEGVLSVFAARLVNNGVIVVSAAANQGQIGGFYAQSPASGFGVISAGAVDNSIYPAQNATVSTGYGPIIYYNYMAFTTGTLPIYAFTTDPTVAADGCTISDDSPDLTGKLVIVRRGGCAIATKAENAYDLGASAIFVVNYEDTVPLYQNFPLIDFALISYEDGNYLLNQIATNQNTTVSFTFSPAPQPNVWTGNTTSYFSEIGPTNDLYFATSILAPGSNIIGVVPTTYANWSITDGTSWSAAFASGAAALYLAGKGGAQNTPKVVREAFEATARPLPFSISDASLATVAAQGAGRLGIYDAINIPITVSPTELALNDTAFLNALQFVTVTNHAGNTVKYSVSNVPAGTALAFQTGLNQSNDGPLPQQSAPASIWIGQSSFTLRPGQTTIVPLKFTPPSGLDASTFPIYSGYVQISGGGQSVKVPYMGVAAKMRDMPIIDPTDWYFGFDSPALIDPDFDVQSGPQSFNFTGDSYPTVLFRLVGGTPLLLIDLVSVNATLGFTPNYQSTRRSFSDDSLSLHRRTPGVELSPRRIKAGSESSAGFSGWLYLWCQVTHGKGQGCTGTPSKNTFGKVPILGNLYEEDYTPRSTDNADGEGGDYSTFSLETPVFSNGTAIPNGTYRFLIRALKITGDMTKESDYEAWLSQPITVAQ
ncbi:putative peptidase [Naematelia encephala]|uniref:Putative peptidase n=1 Tax=Naematelia encephala TaxID=71784 RepID=A0A1Y2BCL3_9TREE|nr:putative peptidase [Naematelia encephala]